MSRRVEFGIIVSLFSLVALVGATSLAAQEKTLATGQPKVEVLVTTELSEVGLSGTSVAQRVTIPAGTMMADHTHTGRTSLLIMACRPEGHRRTAVNSHAFGDEGRVVQHSQRTLVPSRDFANNGESPRWCNGSSRSSLGRKPFSAAGGDR